jgi:hypothetical protein
MGRLLGPAGWPNSFVRWGSTVIPGARLATGIPKGAPLYLPGQISPLGPPRLALGRDDSEQIRGKLLKIKDLSLHETCPRVQFVSNKIVVS